MRGNWPLVPTMDVVVPHRRTMADMLEILDVLVVDDSDTAGDFWRSQPWGALPAPSTMRPATHKALAGASLQGKRFGVPAMYINQDEAAGTGIGGPTGQRIIPRPCFIALWHGARRPLEHAGAQVVVVDFPVVSNYDGNCAGAPTLHTRGLFPSRYFHHEMVELSVRARDAFLKTNADPALCGLASVDGADIAPQPRDSLPDRYAGFNDDIADYPARAHPIDTFHGSATLPESLRALDHTRRIDLETSMARLGLDAVVFLHEQMWAPPMPIPPRLG